MQQGRREFLKKASISAASLTALYWGFTEANYHIALRNNDVCTANDNAGDAENKQKLRDELASSQTMADDAFYATGLGRGQRQFLLFGDIDHSDPRLAIHFYSKEHIDRLADLGVKHVFIEQSKDQQRDYDDLTSGKITPDDFAGLWAPSMWQGDQVYEMMRMRAHSVLYAQAKGISFHCADIKNTDIASKDDYTNLIHSIRDMTMEFQGICGRGALTDSFISAYSLRSPLKTIFAMASGKRVIEARKNDVRRADYIKSIAGTERSVIYYGAAHFEDHETSFKSVLGKENCVHINLIPDLKKAVANELNLEADFAHIVDRKTVYRTGGLPFDRLGNAPAHKSKPSFGRRAFFGRFSV